MAEYKVITRRKVRGPLLAALGASHLYSLIIAITIPSSSQQTPSSSLQTLSSSQQTPSSLSQTLSSSPYCDVLGSNFLMPPNVVSNTPA